MRRRTAKIILIVLYCLIPVGFIFALHSNKTHAGDAHPPVIQADVQSANIDSSLPAQSASVADQPAQPETPAPIKNSYKVVKVVDGDTIKVLINGVTETLRLIGLDTPEISDPRKPAQCFGPESSAEANKLLNGQNVVLEADESQGERDKYGRLLRYIILSDGTNYDEWMISEGFAHEYTFKTAYKYQAKFKAAEKEAKTAKKGLWNPDTCGGDTTKLAGTAVESSALSNLNSTDHPDGCDIKGNISTSGDKIYHLPDGVFYDKTVIDATLGERWFCTEDEAIAAGWRKSKR